MSETAIKIDDIQKAFIKPDGNLKVGVVIPQDETGRIINEKRTIDRGVLPHDDLKKSFKALLPHALNLLRMVPKGSVYDEKYIKKRDIFKDTDVRDFECVGFELKGSDEEPEVSLIVRKQCYGEKHVDIKTPSVKTHGNKAAYPFAAFLVDSKDIAVEEVHEYIYGKYYDSDQITIDHDNPETESEEEEEDEAF